MEVIPALTSRSSEWADACVLQGLLPWLSPAGVEGSGEGLGQEPKAEVELAWRAVREGGRES